MRLLAILCSLLAFACTGPRKDSTPVDPPPEPPVRVERPARTPLAGRTIVVDAGHGGKDTGAPGIVGVPEKTINLGTAGALAQRLRELGASVVESRTRDEFLSLDERAALADRTRCDLFVSVHADSIGRPDVRGATVYLARGAYATSQRAGRSIERALQDAGIPTRGVRNAGFRVLMAHSRPSVLVECGYLTNREEASLLATPEYRARVAEAIAAGVVETLR